MVKIKIDKKSSINQPFKQENNKRDMLALNLGLFTIFLGLAFTYFIYYSQKITDIESSIENGIVEINAIYTPMPYGQITGHKEYYYTNRRDILKKDLIWLFTEAQDTKLSDKERGEIGIALHRTINQIAYFFPFKKLLEFKKDGSVTFYPNNQISIDTSKEVNLDFLKTQIDEIYNWNSSLTIPLRDYRNNIIDILSLEPSVTHDKAVITSYLDKLIEYLDNHFKLGMKIGLLTKQKDRYSTKITKGKVIPIFSLVAICFIVGIVLPLIKPDLQTSRIITLIEIACFGGGFFIIFKTAIYSMIR
jgi:hypothetical protein